LVQRGARLGLELHVVYTLLFVTATMVIAAVGAFALGTGLYRARSDCASRFPPVSRPRRRP
jgi:hypothetical protein